VARLFNAYVAVHWSTATKPTTGADSVWIGVLKRDVRFRFAFEAHNPATRVQAEALLAEILTDRAKRRERTLLTLDFPLGFPRGLAAGLKLNGEAPWRAVWDQLAKMVKDRPDNVNNRFGVGSEINRRLTGGPFPFWGCPPRDTLTTLQPKRERAHGPGDIPEFRHAEEGVKGAMSVWKLYYNGAVGGHAILGIPAVLRLKQTMGDAMKAWPFETGWKALAESDLAGVDVVAAEAAHAMATPATPIGAEPKEATLVRGMVEHLARLDDAGKLGAMFGPAKGVDPAVIESAQTEEGWALGI
jgi:hypothetical protein